MANTSPAPNFSAEEEADPSEVRERIAQFWGDYIRRVSEYSMRSHERDSGPGAKLNSKPPKPTVK